MLKNEKYFGFFSEDFDEVDDVIVFELLKNSDLSEGCLSHLE